MGRMGKKIRLKIILILSLFLFSGCIEIGFGGDYLDHTNTNYMTGYKQFHISVANRIPINDKIILESQWNHYSNGARLGIGQYPNKGLNFFTTQFKIKMF